VPVFLAATGGPALRRMVTRADGWLPVGLGAEQLAQDMRMVQDMAAEHGRNRPLEVCVRANALYSAKPFEGAGRQPFQGSAQQIIEDAAAHAQVGGVTELLLDLGIKTRDAQELMDVATEVYEGLRAAGI
jgi:hypothetical protein